MSKRIRRNEPPKFIDLTLDEFEKRFKPEQDPWRGIDYSDESKFDFADKRGEQHRLWTVVESDNGMEWIICPGFRRVNRIHWVTTERPWPHEEIQVSMNKILDPEDEGYVTLKKVGAKARAILERLVRPHLDLDKKLKEWSFREKGRSDIEILNNTDIARHIYDTLDWMIEGGEIPRHLVVDAKVLQERICSAFQL